MTYNTALKIITVINWITIGINIITIFKIFN